MGKIEKIKLKNIYKNKENLQFTYTQKWIEIINKKEKDKNNMHQISFEELNL